MFRIVLYSEYLFILFPVGVHGISKHIANLWIVNKKYKRDKMSERHFKLVWRCLGQWADEGTRGSGLNFSMTAFPRAAVSVKGSEDSDLQTGLSSYPLLHWRREGQGLWFGVQEKTTPVGLIG